jgi:hypothetical protein
MAAHLLSADPSGRFGELPTKPVELEPVIRRRLGAGLLEHRLGLGEKRARSGILAASECDSRPIQVRHRR